MKKIICNVMAMALLAGGSSTCKAISEEERVILQKAFFVTMNERQFKQFLNEPQFKQLLKEIEQNNKSNNDTAKQANKKTENKTSVTSKILKGLAIALGVAGTAVAGACVHNHVANRQSFYVKGIFEQIKEHIQSLVNNRVCPETSFVEKAKHVVSDLYYRLYYKGQGICQVAPKCFADELNVCDIN